MLLAVESTDRGGSLALADDQRLLEMTYEHSERTHSVRLMPTIQELLERREATLEEVTRIAVATGPGSFTAIRLGVTTAKTLAMVCGARCVAPTHFECMAQFVSGFPGPVRVVIDARRGELYMQRFHGRDGEMVADGEPRLVEPEQLRRECGREDHPMMMVVRPREWDPDGETWPDRVQIYPVDISLPLAPALVHLARRRFERGETESPDELKPLYVRRSDARRSRDGGS